MNERTTNILATIAALAMGPLTAFGCAAPAADGVATGANTQATNVTVHDITACLELACTDAAGDAVDCESPAVETVACSHMQIAGERADVDVSAETPFCALIKLGGVNFRHQIQVEAFRAAPAGDGAADLEGNFRHRFTHVSPAIAVAADGSSSEYFYCLPKLANFDGGKPMPGLWQFDFGIREAGSESDAEFTALDSVTVYAAPPEGIAQRTFDPDVDVHICTTDRLRKDDLGAYYCLAGSTDRSFPVGSEIVGVVRLHDVNFDHSIRAELWSGAHQNTGLFMDWPYQPPQLGLSCDADLACGVGEICVDGVCESGGALASRSQDLDVVWAGTSGILPVGSQDRNGDGEISASEVWPAGDYQFRFFLYNNDRPGSSPEFLSDGFDWYYFQFE